VSIVTGDEALAGVVRREGFEGVATIMRSSNSSVRSITSKTSFFVVVDRAREGISTHSRVSRESLGVSLGVLGMTRRPLALGALTTSSLEVLVRICAETPLAVAFPFPFTPASAGEKGILSLEVISWDVLVLNTGRRGLMGVAVSSSEESARGERARFGSGVKSGLTVMIFST
jgi:hypothetical protein